MGVLKVLN